MRRGVGTWLAGAGAMLLLGIASRNGTAPGTPGRGHLPAMLPPTGITQVTSTATPQLSTPESVELSVRLRHLLSQALAVGYWMLVVIAVVLVTVFVLRVARRVRVTDPQEAQGEVAEPRVDAAALDTASAQSIEELRHGADVAGAIVACWRRLENLAAASGAPRQPWQDTSEYVVDVLSHTAAPAGDLRQLAELYRTTCYAGTPPRAAERHAAIICLERIREALAGARPTQRAEA